mmetsp:Transcript_32051/g.54696  ORF Transcript_32051/g.54696 Transcript_32051/m.54696 type:complete len:167 (-) Transcript_32051:262-762(-)|eukprot:CAMPEP_0183708824 /NCGR_PEP_ID=MMETSP0737-20130205/5015_1 /TAXON_ID=385413 /ORGANISM="Thalassiosira miniscula, Strain CCMP1093" /LENGTH=166 /DNA_ID=CAMNT_0025936773 /DNA_START=226 /DNA_END=726 /DNA_ORIENTATION=-
MKLQLALLFATITRGAAGKGKPDPPPFESKCIHLDIVVRQLFTEDLVLPDGSTAPATDLGEAIYTPGLLQFFSGDVLDADTDEVAGQAYEKFVMIDSDGNDNADGHYMNLGGCSGTISWSGVYFSATETDTYTVVGGTGDFLGAKGVVTEVYDESTGEAIRTIKLM